MFSAAAAGVRLLIVALTEKSSGKGFVLKIAVTLASYKGFSLLLYPPAKAITGTPA